MQSTPSTPGSTRRRRRRAWLKRLALWGAVIAAVLALTGFAGYRVFVGWRARDLAARAKENFEKANYRLAWLQLNSARDLRADDPGVLRVAALIEGAMGQATALAYYEKIAAQSDLTPEDLRTRAELAARFGDDDKFTRAIAALEASGQAQEAGRLRMVRELRQGDIDRAIAEARRAAGIYDDPKARLVLARLLMQRYRPEFGDNRNPSAAALAGLAEAKKHVDGLLDSTLRDDALAFALIEMGRILPADRIRWAEAAFGRIDPGNPALLPAAVALVQAKRMTPGQIHEKLRPAFDAAPLDKRAAYALWLSGAGMPNEALTLITAKEAGESTAAFGARTEALFATDNLDAVLAACEAGGNVDADVLLAAKARAEYARGRGAQGGAAALREAMAAAAKARRLEFLLPTGDAIGASNVVDEQLTELCGDPAVADYAFRAARDRFSRRGRASLLGSAADRALAASPQGAAVQDHGRYGKLIHGDRVNLEETAAAAAAEPANVTFRVTHALNLLRHDKPADALAAFDDITVFADRLPPGQLAVIAAVLAASGDTARAAAAARSIDPGLLDDGEYALLAPLRLPPAK